MKISPNLTVFELTGAQVHLVATDDCLLGIALAAMRQFLAMAADDLFDHNLLDHLFGQNDGFFLHRTAFQHFCRLVVILDQRSRQRLRQFRAVTIERVGLHTQRPAEFIGLLAILDGRVIRHVDRFRDRTRDEALRRRHHGDMAANPKETLAFLAARVGAVEDRIVLFLQMRRTFQRHGSANVVIGCVDIRTGKAQMPQQIEGRIVQLGRRDAQNAGAEILTQCPLVEDEPDVEGAFQRGVHLCQFIRAKAVTGQRGMVDPRRVADGAVTNRIGPTISSICDEE